jgi:UDP-N-acetylglucosamine--N-acetylmuramyl-(pentapeptide) pyrophosphoryl-undecaprenol N-acetylglucosamine transferase
MISDGIRIIAAAGGTGGHLFPAIAAVQELEKMTGNCQTQFIGTSTRIESRVVPSLGYKLNTIPITGFSGMFSFNTLKLPLKIWQSIRISKRVIREFKPDVVICTGAYISYPAGIAAFKSGIPLVLMESNVSPGKTISLLAPKASMILTSFDETAKYFSRYDSDKIKVCGNPVRSDMLTLPDRSKALSKYSFSDGKKTVFIFGGSLGARSINNSVQKMLPNIADKDFQIIWQTGKNYNVPSYIPDNVRVMEFIDDMASAYAAADLVICRSGATTLAELCAIGKPSILVPLQTASNNEQEINGRLLDDDGAAHMISDYDLKENENLLYEMITEYLSDNELLAKMSSSALALGKPNAGKSCAEEILKLLRISK